MSFLDYSNKTSANAIPKEGFQELVRDTFGAISEIMSKSLGPLGSTTMILDGQFTSATKDGFTIFKNLRFTNRYKSMIYNLIKGPCTKLNNTVGDGTTTAIVLTEHLFSEYTDSKKLLDKMYRLPRQFISAWDTVITEITELLASYSRELSNDEIFNVAYVASNGDETIAREIQSIYSKSGAPVIKLKGSPTNRCYVESITGYEFPVNLIDQAYARNEDLSTDERDIHVLFFHCKVDAETFEGIIKPLNEIYRANEMKLLVMAPAYDELLANTVLKSYVNAEWKQYNGHLNLLLSQYSYGKLSPFQAEDLAVILGCDLIDYDRAKTVIEKLTAIPDGELYDFIMDLDDDETELEPFDIRRVIGFAPRAQLSVTNGSIFSEFDVSKNEKYHRQLELAQKAHRDIMDKTDADKKNFSHEVAKANARIAQLRMESYIYYIGADSSLQANVIYDAVDDVIKAVRSAVKFGVVPGCQLSIIRACNELIKRYGYPKECNIITRNDLVINQIGSGSLPLAITWLICKATLELYFDVLLGPGKRELTDIRFTPDSDFQVLVMESLAKNVVYDLETRTYNPEIITSVETDINVLQAASELVKLLISGNQCIFLDTVLNSSEDLGV